MEPFPDLPPLADAAGSLSSGHLWIQELVVGEPVRFSLDDSGRITFADRRGTLDEPPTPSLRATVRFVRGRFDRDAFRAAVSTPTDVTFYGVATRFEGVDYDFGRLPPFLGTDVHDGNRYLPPDRVEQVYGELGLDPVNAVEKEVVAEHFDPADYESPPSGWYDGPPAGLVLRTKGGERAVRRDEVSGSVEPLPETPAAAAAAAVTTGRVTRAADLLGTDPSSAAFEPLFERVLELVYREDHARLPEAVDESAFRSAAAERLRELR